MQLLTHTHTLCTTSTLTTCTCKAIISTLYIVVFPAQFKVFFSQMKCTHCAVRTLYKLLLLFIVSSFSMSKYFFSLDFSDTYHSTVSVCESDKCVRVSKCDWNNGEDSNTD